VVTTLPVLMFALLVQRHIIRGMTGGALSND
jgi:ABC-type glycerol-3-phosphate transport system permease component